MSFRNWENFQTFGGSNKKKIPWNKKKVNILHIIIFIGCNI